MLLALLATAVCQASTQVVAGFTPSDATAQPTADSCCPVNDASRLLLAAQNPVSQLASKLLMFMFEGTLLPPLLLPPGFLLRLSLQLSTHEFLLLLLLLLLLLCLFRRLSKARAQQLSTIAAPPSADRKCRLDISASQLCSS
jgi:hypothetical protein